MQFVTESRFLCVDDVARELHPCVGMQRVVLAVSGGPDSTALMGLFAEWRARFAGPEAIVATVDHGLRPESAQETRDVGVMARRFGFRHETLLWHGEKPATGIPEAARVARYGLLARLCAEREAAAVVLAHTLDDQAETVVMRLARGSGLKGLGGMQASTVLNGVTLLRPLLSFPKARLVATCEAHGWAYVRDPTNQDERYLRPRLRRLMPLLADEGLTAERLAVFAGRASRADAALQSCAVRAIAEGQMAARLAGMGDGAVDSAVFLGAGVEVAIRMVKQLISAVPKNEAAAPGLEQVEAMTLRLLDAMAEAKPFHGTLAGIKLSYNRGCVSVRQAPPRRHSG